MKSQEEEDPMSMYQMPKPVETPSYAKRYSSTNQDSSGFALARLNLIREETRVKEEKERAEAERRDRANASARVAYYDKKIAEAQAQVASVQRALAKAITGNRLVEGASLYGGSVDPNWTSARNINLMTSQVQGGSATLAQLEQLKAQAQADLALAMLSADERRNILLGGAPPSPATPARGSRLTVTDKYKEQPVLTKTQHGGKEIEYIMWAGNRYASNDPKLRKIAPQFFSGDRQEDRYPYQSSVISTGRSGIKDTEQVVVGGQRYRRDDPKLKEVAPDQYRSPEELRRQRGEVAVTPKAVVEVASDKIVVNGQTYRRDDPQLKEIAPDQYLTKEALARSLRKPEDVKIVTVNGRDYRDDNPILKTIAPALYAYAGLQEVDKTKWVTIRGNRYDTTDPRDRWTLEQMFIPPSGEKVSRKEERQIISGAQQRGGVTPQGAPGELPSPSFVPLTSGEVAELRAGGFVDRETRLAEIKGTQRTLTKVETGSGGWKILNDVGWQQHLRDMDAGLIEFAKSIQIVTVDGNRYLLSDPKLKDILGDWDGRGGKFSKMEGHKVEWIPGSTDAVAHGQGGNIRLRLVSFLTKPDGTIVRDDDPLWAEESAMYPASITTEMGIGYEPTLAPPEHSGGHGGATEKGTGSKDLNNDGKVNVLDLTLSKIAERNGGMTPKQAESYEKAWIATTFTPGAAEVKTYSYDIEPWSRDPLRPDEVKIGGHWYDRDTPVAQEWADRNGFTTLASMWRAGRHVNETLIGGNWFSNDSWTVKKWDSALAENDAKIELNRMLSWGQPITSLLGGKSPHLVHGIMSAEDIATAKATGAGAIYERIMANPLVIKDEEHKTGLVNWKGEPIYMYDDPVTGPTYSEDPAGQVMDKRTGKYVAERGFTDPDDHLRVNLNGVWVSRDSAEGKVWIEAQKVTGGTNLFTDDGKEIFMYEHPVTHIQTPSDNPAEQTWDANTGQFYLRGVSEEGGVNLEMEYDWHFEDKMTLSDAEEALTRCGLWKIDDAGKGSIDITKTTRAILMNPDFRQAILTVWDSPTNLNLAQGHMTNEDRMTVVSQAIINEAKSIIAPYQPLSDADWALRTHLTGMISGSEKIGWDIRGIPLNELRNNPTLRQAIEIVLPGAMSTAYEAHPDYVESYEAMTPQMHGYMDTEGMRGEHLSMRTCQTEEEMQAKFVALGLIPEAGYYIDHTPPLTEPTDEEKVKDGFSAGDAGYKEWRGMIEAGGGNVFLGMPFYSLREGYLGIADINRYSTMSMEELKTYQPKEGEEAIDISVLRGYVGDMISHQNQQLHEIFESSWHTAEETKANMAAIMDVYDTKHDDDAWNGLSVSEKRNVLNKYYAPDTSFMGGVTQWKEENPFRSAMQWATGERIPNSEEIWVGTNTTPEPPEPGAHSGLHMYDPRLLGIGLWGGIVGVAQGIKGMWETGISSVWNLVQGEDFLNFGKFGKRLASIPIGIGQFLAVDLVVDVTRNPMYGVGEAVGALGIKLPKFAKVPGGGRYDVTWQHVAIPGWDRVAINQLRTIKGFWDVRNVGSSAFGANLIGRLYTLPYCTLETLKAFTAEVQQKTLESPFDVIPIKKLIHVPLEWQEARVTKAVMKSGTLVEASKLTFDKDGLPVLATKYDIAGQKINRDPNSTEYKMDEVTAVRERYGDPTIPDPTTEGAGTIGDVVRAIPYYVVNGKKFYLLVKDRAGGGWMHAGGDLRVGETAIGSLFRELGEEFIGLDKDNIKLGTVKELPPLLSKAHHHANVGARIYEFEVIDPFKIYPKSHGAGPPEIAHMSWFGSGERWSDVRGSTIDIMGAMSADKDGKVPLDISRMKFSKTDSWTDASRDLGYGKRYREGLEITEKDITDAAVYCSDFTLELARKKTPAMKERTLTVYHITPNYGDFLMSIKEGVFTTQAADTGKRFSFFLSQEAAYQFLQGSSMGGKLEGHHPAIVAITMLESDLARIDPAFEMALKDANRLGVDFQTVWKEWKKSIEDEITAPGGTKFYTERPNFASKTVEGGRFKDVCAVLMTTVPMSGTRIVKTMPKKGVELLVTPAMSGYIEALNNAKEVLKAGKDENITVAEIKGALDTGYAVFNKSLSPEALSASVYQGVEVLKGWLNDNFAGDSIQVDSALTMLGKVQQWHLDRYEYSLRRIHTLVFDMDGTLIAPKNRNLKFDAHGNLLPPEFDKSGKQISGYDPKLTGYEMRPNALKLLQELQDNGKEVVIWSHCSKARLEEVFASLPELEAFFPKDASWKGIDGKASVSGRRNIVIREDYAMIAGKVNTKGEPAFTGSETFKDIQKVGGGILIDDLPAQKIEQTNHGNRAIGISQYMGGKSFAMKDLETVMFPETLMSRLGDGLKDAFGEVLAVDKNISGLLHEAKLEGRDVQASLLLPGAEKTKKEAELAHLKAGGELVKFSWGQRIPILYMMTDSFRLLKELEKDGEVITSAIDVAKGRLDTELGKGSSSQGMAQGIQKQAILTAIEGIRRDLQDKYTQRIKELEDALVADARQLDKTKNLQLSELKAIDVELTKLRHLDSVTPTILRVIDAYKNWVDTTLSGLTERKIVLEGLEVAKREILFDFISPGGIKKQGAPDVRGAIALKRRVLERKVEDIVHFRIRPRSVEYSIHGLLNYETGPFTTTRRRDWTARTFREKGGSLPGEIVKVGKEGEGMVGMTGLMGRYLTYVDAVKAIFLPRMEQFKAHTVIIDLDGTIVAEGKGKHGKKEELRPGAVDFLIALDLAGKEVILWTHSDRARTQRIVNMHPDLQAMFNDPKTGKLDPMKVKTREDYAIDKNGKVLPVDTFKDISIFGKDSVLIDNNKSQIKQQEKANNHAVDISTYYGGKSSGLKDMFRQEMVGRGQFVTPAEAKMLQDLYKEREIALETAKEVADSASALNLVRELQAKMEERMKEAEGTIFTTVEAKELLELYKKRDEVLASDVAVQGLEKTQLRIAELELKQNANKFAYSTYVFDFDGCVVAQGRGKGKYKPSEHEMLHLVGALKEWGEEGPKVKVRKVKDEPLVRELRPGVIELMQAMQRDGKQVVIWTHSTEKRMQGIVDRYPELQALFNDPLTGKLDPKKVTTFKDYAGGRTNAGNKDIFKPVAKKYGTDSILIDNSATQVALQREKGYHAVKITTYRGGKSSGMSSLFVPQAKVRTFTAQTYVFNLLGTLISESKDKNGKYELRPGAVELLRELENNGKQVVLWTDLRRQELKRVLGKFPDTLQKIFPEVWNDKNYNDKKVRCHEDYIKRGDPFSTNKFKNVRREFGENSILIDNNKMQIDLQKSAGNKYAEVSTYNGGKSKGLADLFMEDVKGTNQLISASEAKELQVLQGERARALGTIGKDSGLVGIQARISELEAKKNANTFTYDTYVFSLEGTISAEGKGKNGKVDELRPGAVDLLVALSTTGKNVVIWTHLDKERAQRIIDTSPELQAIFNKDGKLDPTKVKTREDYAIDKNGKVLPVDTFKDISIFGKDSVLIDNNKNQIQQQKDNKNKAVSITTYHGGKSSGMKDMLDVEMMGMGQLIAPAVAEVLLSTYKARENALNAAKEASGIAGTLDLVQDIQAKIARMEAERMEELGGLAGTGKLLTPKEATQLMELYKKRDEALISEARVSELPKMELRIKELEAKQKATKYSYGTYVFDFGTIVSQGKGKAKGKHALRPGVIELMQAIQGDGKVVAIWAHSDRKLTQEIVNMHPDLANIFNDPKTGKLDPTRVKTHEDYARFKDENTFKDMRKEFGIDSVLIDSNASQIKQQHGEKNNVVEVAPLEATGKMSSLLTGNEKVRKLTSGTYIFNLVGTLVSKDKEGKYELRPGAMELLQELKNEGKNTVLWTDLSRQEVGVILGQLHTTLGKIFPSIWDYKRVRSKEHYGGEQVTKDTYKDIRREFGVDSILIDNNKSQIEHQRYHNNKYAEVSTYNGGKSSGLVDLFMEDAMGKSAVISVAEAKELQVLQAEHAKALELKGKDNGLAGIQARIAELEAKARFAYDTYVLDLDGTIVAEGKGKGGKKEELRPGTVELLNALVLANKKIVIWTHSTEKRTQRIVNENPLLATIFNDPKTGKLNPARVKTREGYALDKDGKVLPKDTFKDIRKEFGENSILIDNSASQIKKQHNAGNNAADISTYYGGKSGGLKELGAQLMAEAGQIARNADTIGTMKKWAEENLPEKPTQADITEGINLTKKYIKRTYGREETYAGLIKGVDALNDLLQENVKNGASKGDIISLLGASEAWFVGEREGLPSSPVKTKVTGEVISKGETGVEARLAEIEVEIKILEDKARSEKLTMKEALAMSEKYAERDALIRSKKGKETSAEKRGEEERRNAEGTPHQRGITEFGFGGEERKVGEERGGAGEYPHGEYPHGEYPAGEYPAGEYPHGEYPAGEYKAGEYPHGEYPEGEYPKGEYPHGEYPHGEYKAGEYPHKEYHLKEVHAPIIKKKKGKVLTQAELEASIAWKQGIMYKLIYPPYGQSDIINSRVPFPGMHIHSGVRSAFATLIRTQKGRLPSTIVRDMGMMHIRIEGGGRSTTAKPKMRFHEREERRGKGAVKTKESNGQVMTKINGGKHG